MKKKVPYYLIAIFCLLFPIEAFSQFLPINQPEQDACGALQICNDSFSTPNSYEGGGLVQEPYETITPLPDTFLAYAHWLKVKIATPGNLVFKLTPRLWSDNYDFYIFSPATDSCLSIKGLQAIRSNTKTPTPNTLYGITGLKINVLNDSFGAIGEFSKYISANAGDVYYILINAMGPADPTAPLFYKSLPTKGYKIDFTGSTCTFVTGNPVQIDSVGAECTNYKYITLYLSKLVACNSIETLGSDFEITNGTPFITTGVGCSSTQKMTQQIKIELAPNLSPGTYTIKAKEGTDGNTVVDMCGVQMPINSSATFIVPKLDSNVYVTLCPQQLPYHWNNQIITTSGNNIATFTTPNYMGCDSVSKLSVAVVNIIKDTSNIFICSSQLPYHWNGITINNPGMNVANFTTIASTGCDSMNTLNLSILIPQSQSLNYESCGPFLFEGNTYSQSLTINDTIHSNFGCDSLYRNIIINVHPDIIPITKTIDTAGCGYLSFNNQIYILDTTITDTIQTVNNCDSVYLKYKITIYPNVRPAPTEYTVSDCSKVDFEGKIYTSDTSFTVLFRNHIGCDSAIRNTHIIVQQLNLELTSDPNEPVKGDYVVLSTHANENYSITSWLPASLFPNQNANQQSFIIQKSDSFIVIGKSENGCIDTTTLYLHPDSLIPVALMPNAFTPNGDGLNDLFEPFYVSKSGYFIKRFQIFDRWGKLVYKASGIKNAGWNGTYSNSGEPATQGTYYYFIDIEFIDHTTQSFKGDVLLIR